MDIQDEAPQCGFIPMLVSAGTAWKGLE